MPIGAIVIKARRGLQNLKEKGKTKRIMAKDCLTMVVVVNFDAVMKMAYSGPKFRVHVVGLTRQSKSLFLIVIVVVSELEDDLIFVDNAL